MLCLSEALPQEPQGMQTLHLTSAQAEQNVCPADGVLSISIACNATDVEAAHASLASKGLHRTRSSSRELMQRQVEENLDQSGQVASAKSADEHDCTCRCQVLSGTEGHCRGLRRS